MKIKILLGSLTLFFFFLFGYIYIFIIILYTTGITQQNKPLEVYDIMCETKFVVGLAR